MAFLSGQKSMQKSRTPTITMSGVGQIQQFAIENNISLYPLDIESLVRMLGVNIVKEDGDDSFSGCIEKRGSEYYLIINKYHNPRRQRFTLAHELAHYILHKDKLDQIGRETILMREPKALSAIEREANDFAAELLMPKNIFLKQVEEGLTTLTDLADFFQVSVPAIKYRALCLGLLRE